MQINSINNTQFKSSENNGFNKIKKSFDENKPTIELFALGSALGAVGFSDRIRDGFSELSKTKKVGRMAKWMGIVLACGASVSIIPNFINNCIDKITKRETKEETKKETEPNKNTKEAQTKKLPEYYDKKAHLLNGILSYLVIFAAYPHDTEKLVDNIDINFKNLPIKDKAKNVAKFAAPLFGYPLLVLLGLGAVAKTVEHVEKERLAKRQDKSIALAG